MTETSPTDPARDPQVKGVGVEAGDETGHAADAQDEGQVSEVGRLDPAEADTPISDDQSVAGSPSDESGRPDEGPTGPNSRGGSDRN